MVVDNQNGTEAIISKAYQYVTSTGYGEPNDNDGRIKKITDNIDGAYTMIYGYDEYNRLYVASSPAASRVYNYDAWGNIKEMWDNSWATPSNQYTLPTNGTGAPATNRMSVVTTRNAWWQVLSTTNYTWDAAGNMTGEGATSFQYDAANRLKSVNNGTGGSYGFDGNSQRVKKVEGSTTLYYVRSSIIGQAVMEVSGSSVHRAYVYNGGSMVAMQGSDGQFYWRHSNHLGSGSKLTNTSGTVVYRAEHDPYGNVLLETGSPTLTAHKFTSYERDGSGLDYANARMFSGSRGRFTKPDPAGLSVADARPQSLNRYSYASNDPVNRVDRTGLDDDEWDNLIWYLTFGTFLGEVSYDMTTIGYIGGGDVDVSRLFWSWQDPPRPTLIVLPTPNHPDIPLVVQPPYELRFKSFLDSTDAAPCVADLAGIGVTPERVLTAFRDTRFYDLRLVGNEPAVMYFDPSEVRRNGFSISTTLRDYILYVYETDAVSIWGDENPRPGIYHHDDNIFSDQEFGFMLHELVHHITGLNDTLLAGRLGVMPAPVYDGSGNLLGVTSSQGLSNYFNSNCTVGKP
jgi:RHS repeat-associated protein